MKTGGSVRRLVAGLLLAATLLGAFHHHHDLKPHPECSVCVLVHHHSAADLPPLSFALPETGRWMDDFGAPLLRPAPLRPLRTLARAPPKLS